MNSKQRLYRWKDMYDTKGTEQLFTAVVKDNVRYHICHCKTYRKLNNKMKHSNAAPLAYGTPGILNFISPLLKSVPVTSILTDDIGILHEGAECGCGIESPYFEVLGRAGLDNIVTCAANAANLLAKEED